MQLQTDQFRQAYSDFRRLQVDHQLPPLMELKLAFLQGLLTAAPETNDIGEKLQVFQRESIEELPRQTQEKLFINIVRCLSGREIVTFCRGQLAYLRREGKLFSWDQFYLDCNTNILGLKRKQQGQDYQQKFQLSKLGVSKQYKRYKGKYVWAIEYENAKYVIGFDLEITCERVQRILVDLIEQQRQRMMTKFDNRTFNQQREAQRLALPSHKIKQMIKSQEYQHLLAVSKKIKQLEQLDETQFRLCKNMKEGRVLVGKSGKIKAQILLNGVTATRAAEYYLQMSVWNSFVEQFDILVRLRANTLLARMRTKKYSLFSYPRQVTLALTYFKPCRCKDSQLLPASYLLIQDIPTEEQPLGAVSMKFKQLVKFIPSKEDSSCLLVTVNTEAEFKGFCNQSDNTAMSLHLAEQIEQYSKHVNQNKSKQSGYFEDGYCCCGSKQYSQFLTEISLPNEKQEIDGQPERKSLKALAEGYEFTQKRVVAAIEDVCKGVVNEDFLQIMKSHAFESYYCKHHFSEEKEESIAVLKGENSNFLSEGTRWQIEGELMKFIDEEALSAQKSILKMILKQFSSNIMQGRSIMNMSLPVQIFDKRSTLDAIADSYGFLAAYSSKIVAAIDPIEQIKLLICGFMFLHTTGPSVEKPFNPILGQTYQGKIGELPVYLEQISHHPPISSILIKTKDFQMFGNVQLVIDMGLNSVNSFLCQWLRAKVHSTGSEYLIKVPDVSIEGVIYGDRVYKVVNKGFILELKSNLFAEFSVGKDKKRVYESKPKLRSSDISGGIFRVKQQFADKVKACPKPKSFEGVKPQFVIQTCSLIGGKWFGDIFFDGVCYKSRVQGPFPFRSERLKYLLPSDSVWREDLVFKIWKDHERSNREKERLENIQRNDRKLRQKYKKER